MRNPTKKIILATILTLINFIAFSQDTLIINPDFQLSGTWTVCTETTFSKDYKCTNGYINYTFNKNNKFTEHQGKRNWKGKYKINGNYLSIKRNDTKFVKHGTNSYNIIWLDENRFYSIGQEGPGGIDVFTYFEKIK